jgi:hypothetical protein
MSTQSFSAKTALLQLTDQSNWPDDMMMEDEWRGYKRAMEAVHQIVMEFWSELDKKELPE